MSNPVRSFVNITLHGARLIRDRAIKQAAEKNLPIAVVVIDRAGLLIVAETMDDAPPGSSESAMMKAKGAARYREATHRTGEYIKTLSPALAGHVLALPELCAMQGGMPIMVDNHVVGGVGVSGGNGDQDIQIAIEAAKTVQPSRSR